MSEFSNGFVVLQSLAPNASIRLTAKQILWPNILVILVLLLMTARAAAIATNRLLIYSAARRQSRSVAPQIASVLRSDRFEEAISLSAKHWKSPLAALVNAAFQEFLTWDRFSDVTNEEIDSSTRAVKRALAIQSAELRRGLSELSTIGSTAPLVGLIGLLIGLMHGLHYSHSIGLRSLKDVVADMVNAFLIFSAGLAIGVVSKMLFGYLNEQMNRFILEMENVASEIFEFVHKNRQK